MDQGRRLNPRLEIELPAEVKVRAVDEPQPGTIANLSVGGAAVRTGSQLPPHSLLSQFRFDLPDEAKSEPVETAAVVVHAHPVLDSEGNIEYCSGVHFLGLETSLFQRLERFVKSQLETEAR